MVLDLGGSKRHCATNVRDLQPRAVETFRRRTFRQHANRSLGHDLRNELVRVEKSSGDGDEECSLTCTARIVADVSHFSRFVAGEFSLSYRSKLFSRYRFGHIDILTTDYTDELHDPLKIRVIRG